MIQERERLPITAPLLILMKAVLESDAEFRDKDILWAAYCIAFFTFLRVGELTVPSDGAFDPAVHLGISDVAVDNLRVPSMVRIRIKQCIRREDRYIAVSGSSTIGLSAG